MLRWNRSLARSLEFGNTPTNNPVAWDCGASLSPARLRRGLGLLRGADQYEVLEKRRRAAQIKARHALALAAFDEGR